MSSRPQRKSIRSSLNRPRHSMIVASDDAFSYALRTAYLHYLLQPRPRRQVAPPAQQLAAINRISTSSFQDLVADFSRTHRDPKSIRFPKGFLPLLRDRITAVVMGHDLSAEYKDPSLKPTFGSFYVAFIEPRFYDNAAKSRRPEDLLLIFYTHATRELKKLKPDDSWKPLVDRHVALFVRLMGAVIKEQGWSSSNPELTLRLATLEKKLLRHDENLAEDGSSRGSTPATILGPPEPLSYNVNDMPMVKTVARVFCVPLETCQQDINSKMGIWTEKAAFQDLKAYMSNISLNTTRTLRKEDFDLNEAYEAWCKSEKAELADLILVMGRSHQELISSSISPAPSTRAKLGHMSSLSSYDIHGSNQMHRTSMYESPSTMHGGGLSVDSLTFPNGNGAEGDDDAPYVYVPPDPRVFYRHIVNRCLTADYTDQDVELEPIDIPGADEPARLLSKGSLELLNQCALRWRVPKFSRMVLFMDAFRSKYQEQSVDISMLDNAFMYFDKEVDTNWVSWTVSDQNMYRVTLSSVHDYILRELCDLLQHAYDKKQVPIGAVMWVLDQHIYNNELFIKGSLDEFVEQTKDILKENAADVLQAMFDEEISQQGDQLDPLHVVNLAQKVIKLTERISKRFKSPVLDVVDPTMIFMEVVYPKLAIQTRDVVQGLIQQSKAAGEEMAIDDGFELYKELSEVRRIYLEAFPKREYPVRLEDLFVDFPIRWLQTVDSKVIGWVAAAIQEDHLLFKWPEGKELGDERHTSSVVDIFRSFSQSIEQIKKLDWQDELQYAKFMTIMSKVFGKGLMRYCEELETFFTHEMGKKTPEQEAALSQTKQQKWMSMAKDAWSNKEKVEPFQFAPESCLKLNNIEFAINKFDMLEQAVDSERMAAIINRHEPPARGPNKSKYVFTVKIMEAENLKAMDMNGYSDPYVVLGDEYHKRLGKTRIVYNNLNPRWEETFDITTTGPILLIATLWDWDTVGDHDCLGRTSLKLDPTAFSDFQAKEQWIDLDSQGRLLLRISMEGERDDIQFHFGKAFRTLKRTERDMTRQITDKLSAYIHHCLSLLALRNVISKGYGISAVSNLFGRAGFGAARPASSQGQSVSKADIAAALNPLTDYFNENFAILNTTLTPSAMTLAMTKLWKEVLVTLEALLVPTLSDKPSQQKQLTATEMGVVFEWLKIMYDFFLAADETGEATGVPVADLKTHKYHELQTLNFFYFEDTNELVRSSERIGNEIAARQESARQKLANAPPSSASASFASNPLSAPGGQLPRRAKSVLNKRNLGTMRRVKEEKRREAQAEPSDDIILRILRMRPEAAGYLRDRARQKEKIESIAAMDAIVARSQQMGPGRMGRR